eukprot:7294587-Ditylum_brightwellii.AAC.1
MWSDIQDKYLCSIKLHTRCSNGASWAKQNAMKCVMERANKASKNTNGKFCLQKLKLCICSKTDSLQETGIPCSQTQ